MMTNMAASRDGEGGLGRGVPHASAESQIHRGRNAALRNAAPAPPQSTQGDAPNRPESVCPHLTSGEATSARECVQ